MRKLLIALVAVFLATSSVVGLLPTSAEAAISAGLLPNGNQTFLDANGNPLTGGKVYFYIPSTTTNKTTWQDPTQAVANTNPVTLDAAGRAVIYGSGQYRQVVKDSLGNTIWDNLTYGSIPPSTTFGTQTSLPSALVTDLGTTGTNNVLVTGTTTIQNFGSTASTTSPLYFVQFSNALTLTYNASSMKLLNGVSQTVVAGQSMIFQYLGAGQWQQIQNGGVGYNGQVTVGLDGQLQVKTAIVAITTDAVIPITDQGTMYKATLSLAANATLPDASVAKSGWNVQIVNLTASSNTLTVLSGGGTFSGGAANAGSSFAILPGGSATFTSDGTNWIVSAFVQVSPTVVGSPSNLLITTANGGTTAAISADEVALESPAGGQIVAKNVSCTIAYSSTGAGKLDTGVIAIQRPYFNWIIYNPTTYTVSCLGSTSSTAPTMPAGYVYKARVGTSITQQASAVFQGTIQKGRYAQFRNPVQFVSGIQGTYSATAPTYQVIIIQAISGPNAFVPTTASRVTFSLNGNLASGTSAIMYLAPFNSSYGGYQSANPPPLVAGVQNGVTAYGSLLMEGTGVYVVSSNTQGAAYINGWEDNL